MVDEDSHGAGSPWSEDDSATFLELAEVFVPERERQVRTLCELLPATGPGDVIVELGCGEGRLAEVILSRHQQAVVWGLDGSPAMLAAAGRRLQRFGERWRPRPFDLAALTPADLAPGARAVLSSLAVHHLDAAGKRRLFASVHQSLSAGGVLLLADLVAPAWEAGIRLAAEEWDAAAVRQARESGLGEAAAERFAAERWNHFRFPDPADLPSPLADQLDWLRAAGFVAVDVFWMLAGHAIYGGRK
ncbi:MAG TPA: class I SAM-dependent methyltransferase [Thermoanaerobaculia bacterium]|nr:class I SAM-dependent methyltransferase [Thermoanaerobaculia bacterium]